jgi:hypothetical protein
VLVSAALEGDSEGDDVGEAVHLIAHVPSLHLHQPG